jgi:hypothetical protein
MKLGSSPWQQGRIHVEGMLSLDTNEFWLGPYIKLNLIVDDSSPV